jgi:hypothetical protein
MVPVLAHIESQKGIEEYKYFMRILLTDFEFLLNSLNAELNPTCHLLILLGDLTFMAPCIVSIFQYTCISNKMQSYIVYLYLETALHCCHLPLS